MRFENYFRILSGKLTSKGKWLSAADHAVAFAAIGDQRIRKLRGGVSNVALAYKIMKLDQSLPIVQHCTTLDDLLFANSIHACDGEEITDVGDRIAFGRHNAGHGEWGDLSSEGLFYGLMTAVVFYSQP